jgi:hypothetical protein
MNLTADQQFQLLTRMATQAAAAGVPQDQIEAKLSAFKTKIEAGENVFAPVFDRAREITKARKNFNQPDAPWTPLVSQVKDEVRMSPSSLYRDGYDQRENEIAALDADKAAYDAENSFFTNLSNAATNAASTAGRTLIAAGVGAKQLLDPAGSGVRAGLGVSDPGEDMAFSAIDALREKENLNKAKGAGGIVGSLLGGIGTLGLGSLSSGQDVLEKGGSLGDAVAATAVDAARLEASLLTGKLLPNSSVAARSLAQGTASGALGIPGRAVKNEFVPESMKQEVFDPLSIALDVGGGAAGGIFPNRPRVSAPATIKTGDPAIDAGIGAVEKMMGKGVDTSKKTFDIDVNEPFKQFFEVPRKDFSTNPRETVDAEAFLNEPRKQDEIKKAYDQLKAERRATEELAYAQKATADAAIYQELPGVMPTDPVRGAAEQAVPRGTNLNLDQLSVLRDQLRTRTPEAPAPSGPQHFNTEFAPDARSAVQAEAQVSPIERPVPDVSYLNRKARKIAPSNDWQYNPTKPLAEQVPPETVAQIKQTQALDLEAKMAEIASTKPFDGSVPKPIRLAGNLAEQTTTALTRSPTPRVVEDLYNSGELRSGDVIGSIMDDSEGIYKGADQFRSMMGHLNSLGEKLGGLDTPVIRFDPNNALHASVWEEAGFPNREDAKVGAFYNPRTNTIYSMVDRPPMKLLVHEVTHAITNRVLDMGEAGKLLGPAKQAYSDFSTLFDTLKPQLAEMAGKDINKNYGLENLHEYMSEFYSNPTFRDNLKQLKITPEYTQKLGLGRLAVAKMKNLYEATTQFIRKSFGLPERAESALDLLFSASHRFTESIDDTTANQSRAANSTETRAGLLSKEQSDKLKLAGKVAAVGDGSYPLIRQAKEMASGEKALGVTTAETMGNLYNKETRNLSAGDIKAIDKDIEIAIKNSGKPEGKAAVARLDQATPAIAGMVREFAASRRAEALQYARNILDNPNVTDADKGLAYKILENVDSYLVKAYDLNEFKNYGRDKLALAKKAEAKLAAGKTPFEREQKALNQTNALKAYLKKRYFPDNLDSLRSNQLEELYTYFTGKQVSDVAPLDTFGDTNAKALRKDFMRGEIRNGLSKVGDIDQAITDLTNVVAGVNKSAPSARYFKNLREGSDVKSTLDDVPEEIRKFWGEAEKPVARMMQTVRNQAAINSQMNVLSTLRKEGMGKLFVEGKGVKGMTETIEGEKMGPLQGLNTTPEIKYALESFVQTGSFLGDWSQILLGDPTGNGALTKAAVKTGEVVKKVTSARKSASVLGNFLGSVLRNGYGSFLQAAANGNINPVTWAQGVGDMAGLIGLSKKTELTPQTKKYIKYKVAEASQLEDAYSPSAKRVLQKLLDTEGFRTPDTFLQKAGEAVKDLGYTGSSALKIMKEIYGAADLWSKLANFRAEETFWTAYNQKYGGINDVTKFVADRINNTNITPGRASPVAKLSDHIGASTFLPYTTEVARTLYNNVAYGTLDAVQGAKLGRPELMMHGVKRVLGAAGATAGGTALLAGLTSAGSTALGLTADLMDEDSDRKKYLSSKNFSAGSVPISVKDSSGKEYTLDAGMMNPYDPVARPINLIIAALGESDPKKKEAKLKEAGNSAMGLLHQNGAWGMIGKAIEGKTPSVAKSNERAYQLALETLVNDFGLSKENADRVINLGMIIAPKGILEAYKGSTEETDTPIKAIMATGIGLNRLDVRKDVENYEGGAFTAELNKAKKGYTDLLKVDFAVDPSRVEDEFKKAIKDLAEPYTKLQLAVNAAREQGATKEQIRDSLKLGKVNNKAIAPLLNGKSPPIRLIISSLNQDINDDLMRDKSEKAKDRARRNRGILRDLVQKYKDVTAADLAELDNLENTANGE